MKIPSCVYTVDCETVVNIEIWVLDLKSDFWI